MKGYHGSACTQVTVTSPKPKNYSLSLAVAAGGSPSATAHLPPSLYNALQR